MVGLPPTEAIKQYKNHTTYLQYAPGRNQLWLIKPRYLLRIFEPSSYTKAQALGPAPSTAKDLIVNYFSLWENGEK